MPTTNSVKSLSDTSEGPISYSGDAKHIWLDCILENKKYFYLNANIDCYISEFYIVLFWQSVDNILTDVLIIKLLNYNNYLIIILIIQLQR